MDWFVILQVLYIIILIGVIIKVVQDTQSSVKASAYILLIILLPVVGIIIYLSFGLNYRKRGLYSKKLILDKNQAADIQERIDSHRSASKTAFKSQFPELYGLSEMVYAEEEDLITQNNEIQLLTNGEEKFPEVLQALERAQHHIHMEYYIYEDDKIGNKIAEILIRKASEGVEVRFIYDDFGSRKIRKKLVPKMRKAGIKAFPFYKIIFIYLANRINYRNHRKIIIIDGAEAFVGGINVADGYSNPNPDNLYWRDTHIHIKGEAVWSLQKIFFADWNFCSGDSLKPDKNYYKEHPAIENGQWTQIAASGPDSLYPNILYSYLQTIFLAQEEILITSPYFIPGEDFIEALKIAALRGVVVKIIVPGVADSLFVNAVSKSHYNELLAVGVEIYLYNKGFVHAKTIVCDEKVSMVGTANLDHRSFELNFEVNAVIYDETFARSLKKEFENDTQFAKKIELNEWRNRSWGIRFLEKFLKLLSPLM